MQGLKDWLKALSGIRLIFLILTVGVVGNASARYMIDGGGGAAVRNLEQSFTQSDTKAGTAAWIKITLKVSISTDSTGKRTFQYSYLTDEYKFGWFASFFLNYALNPVIGVNGAPMKGIADEAGGIKTAYYQAALNAPKGLNIMEAYVRFDPATEKFEGYGKETFAAR